MHYPYIWRLRGNIITTAPCWVVWVWHNVHSQQHTHVSSSYRSSRLGLSHWDPYAMHRGGCLELYYCNTVEWSRWDSSLIWKTNWLPSVLWHCWFGHMTCNNHPWYYLCVWCDVKPCWIIAQSIYLNNFNMFNVYIYPYQIILRWFLFINHTKCSYNFCECAVNM